MEQVQTLIIGYMIFNGYFNGGSRLNSLWLPRCTMGAAGAAAHGEPTGRAGCPFLDTPVVSDLIALVKQGTGQCPVSIFQNSQGTVIPVTGSRSKGPIAREREREKERD